MLISILWLVLWTYLLYLHFLAYTAIHAAREVGTLEQLPWLAKSLAGFILVSAYAMDVSFNIVIGSVIFFELPHTWTFTKRCELHFHDENWRGSLARWICKWLNPIMPGHCH